MRRLRARARPHMTLKWKTPGVTMDLFTSSLPDWRMTAMTKFTAAFFPAVMITAQLAAHQQPAEFRQRTMEQLTPDERAHLQANGKINRAEWIKEHPARESTGLIALPDLGKGMYKGEQGGLYPGGVNAPPKAHLQAGLEIARKITPLDADGRPSPNGKIVLISAGMSNTTMKFQTFQKIAADEHGLNPHLVIVDGAQGGQVAWVTSKAHAPYWEVDDERLKAAGVTRAQVQAAWILQANPGPNRPFPTEVKELQQNVVD